MTHEAEILIELFKRGNIDLLSLSDKQREAMEFFIDDLTKEILYGGAAGGGKTFLVCTYLVLMCYAFPGTKYYVCRKQIKDLEGSVSISLYKVCDYYGIDKPRYNGQKNWFVFPNGSQIDYKEGRYRPEDPLYERLGSIEYTQGWTEEGGEVPFDAYDTLKSRIGRHLNLNYCTNCGNYNESPKLNSDKSQLYCAHCNTWNKGILSKSIITCNPKKNWMYKIFYKPFKEGILKNTMRFIAALVQDNPYLGKDYVDNLNNLNDKAKKERLLKGNWEYDDDPSWLINSYDLLVDIFKNQGVSGKKYITCDAARFGSDKAIILVWEGFKIVDFATFDISKTTDISRKIKEFQSKYIVGNSNTIVDSDGVGGGVVDEVGCVGFVNNASPIKSKDNDNYDNIQSQCGFMLADAINESQIAFDCDIPEKYKEEITEELEQLKRDDIDDDRKKRLLKKKDIKQNIGRSPDWRDALLMRFYFELNTRVEIVVF